ncbi:MAG: tyrosine 2,3-aminomutase [Patescibacteria group bacterium]|nr:tyrosine 2,3-aminomutase [Patescibacteria group bacterium]
MDSEFLFLTGEGLGVNEVHEVAFGLRKVQIAEEAKKRIIESREMLDLWVDEEKIVYGITTGFGPLVSVLIPKKHQSDLQENLIRSHSSNVGPLFSKEEVRAAMLLRINAFCKGYSAIRLETVELMVAMLNKGLHPCVPQFGSVGASGDLTPSSHIALSLMGEGKTEYQGEILDTKEALKKTGLEPVKLMAKEGLALINGTTMMTGVAALQVYDTWNLIRTAEAISALSIEVLLGSIEPFLVRAHELAKPHPGQINTAYNLSEMLKDSKLIWTKEKLKEIQEKLQNTVKENGNVTDSSIHVQNVYSLRATPQILGAVRDALDYITRQITTEMNSANDNPLFFKDMDMVYQGAHFHGQPVAMPMDMLSISLTEIAILSERRLNKMLDRKRSEGLTPFLAGDKFGLRCGFEGAQYIPTSLVAECRTMCVPASIQSIPSNEENQDVVSMGLVAARKARDIKEKISYVLSVELLVACNAAEERGIENLSSVGKKVYDLVRADISKYDEDRQMSLDIEKMNSLIKEGSIVTEIKKIIPDLK